MRAAHAVTPALAASDAYMSAYEQLDHIIEQLRSPQNQRMTHSEVETLVETKGREMLRRLVEAHLDERSPGTVAEPVCGADGQPHSHQRIHSRQLETIFGQVTLSRQGYGGPDRESLHPLDAELNLPPERYSHTVRQRVAEAAAQQSYDEVVAAMTAHSGAHVPKRQAEELVKQAAQDFEAFYQRQRQATARQVQASSTILVISTDGKGVPMRRADLRPATRAAAQVRQPHLAHRRSKGEKPHSKRIGTVAAVYTIAPWVRTAEDIVAELGPSAAAAQGNPSQPTARPRPEDKRVWASVQQPPETIISQAFTEARRRDPEQKKAWVALVDGNRKQLKLLKQASRPRQAAKDSRGSQGTLRGGVSHEPSRPEQPVTIILDLIHVLEYLWRAAWVLHQEGDPAAEQWVRVRLAEILRGNSSLVAAGLRRSATLRGLRAKARAPLDKCADYLLKYRPYLRYDQYLAAGYPIATGVIEGACRYLVKDRMERTGARWRLTGAEAVLRLRSLRASGDFEKYWVFHLKQEQKRNHAAHYAGGKIPMPNPPLGGKAKGSALRLVKK